MVLARKIQEVYPSRTILISQDSYYKDLGHLSYEQRSQVNFDHPQSLDFEMLRSHLLDLKYDRNVNQPVYNFHTHSRDRQTHLVKPAEIIIVEGILLFAVPEVSELFDLKIFVDADDDIRFLRRMERDIHERSRTIAQVKEQYLHTVKPMHDAFVAPSKQHADVIIPKGGYNEVALGMILAKINEELNGPVEIFSQPIALEN